jgi:hypothetical protein|tara:strand:- start:10 stop:243 length:234 start_codon:yes stop_codon:yes gene_type:complete
MKKYLVIEHHKFKTFNDDWTIKYANVDEDTAFTKMVALRTLNEDTNKIYYVVDMEYLWTKDKLNDNEVKEDKQQMLF